MVEKVVEIFACTLRHLVVGADLFLGAAARLHGAVKEGGRKKHPTSLLLSPGSCGRCLVPPYV